MNLYISHYSLQDGEEDVLAIPAHTQTEAWEQALKLFSERTGEELSDNETLEAWVDAGNYVSMPQEVKTVSHNGSQFEVLLLPREP